jgi:hypothetical protein
MRAVFDHSWGLLSVQEQERLAQLSAFQGSHTSEAAHQVTGAALHELRALVAKSLLHRTSTGRYEMHELLRQYAAQKLNTSRDVERSVCDRQCAYYCAALRDWEADLKSSRQQTALAQMDAEIKNVRAAWDWAVQHEYLEQLDQAAESLGLFYLWRFRGKEGRSAFGEAAERLTKAGERLPAHKLRVLAKVLAWQSRFSDAKPANQLLKQSKALLEKPELADQNALQERAFVALQVGWRELDVNRK